MKKGKRILIINIPITYFRPEVVPAICDEISIRSGLPVEREGA